MDEMRCSFCDDTEAQAGRLYRHDVRPDDAPPRPLAAICAECSESINFMMRTRLAHDGRRYESEAEFPPIASHRFPLLGPKGQETEATVEIGQPYTVDDHTARCPLTITGPAPVAQHHVSGAGSLQALCLAIDFAYRILGELSRQGWKWHGEGSCDLDVLFGRKIAGAQRGPEPRDACQIA